MNISSQIFTIYGSHFFSSFFNDTEVNDFKMSSVVYIICGLLSFPPNSYVIWLILTGTGNGLAAEIFIINLSACEILLCLESLLLFFNYVCKIPWIVVAFLDGLFITGRPLFHCLICVERYLAVVHPVTFLKYKPLRYRLMCSAVAWIATVVTGGFNALILSFISEVHFICIIITFIVFQSIQLFCCLAVLRALKQSGPGERGREREEENNMKRRAFNFILITTVSMCIIYVPYIILILLIKDLFLENENILICFAQLCFMLAGLVEPVLFLFRVEKLNFIRCQYCHFQTAM